LAPKSCPRDLRPFINKITHGVFIVNVLLIYYKILEDVIYMFE